MDINKQIVEEAMNWIGVKYQHRAVTKQGCDCTGLIIGIMQTLGYMKNYKMRVYPSDWNLHAMADNYITEELDKYADKVSDMRSGDILLFSFGKCVAHIGILLKNKLFIHNYRNAGKCGLSSIMNGSWKERLVGTYRFDINKILEVS